MFAPTKDSKVCPYIRNTIGTRHHPDTYQRYNKRLPTQTQYVWGENDEGSTMNIEQRQPMAFSSSSCALVVRTRPNHPTNQPMKQSTDQPTMTNQPAPTNTKQPSNQPGYDCFKHTTIVLIVLRTQTNPTNQPTQPPTNQPTNHNQPTTTHPNRRYFKHPVIEYLY